MIDFEKNAVPWQKDCIKEIKDKNNVILSSPTGSGKTSVYMEWARLKGNNKVYITAPIKALSNQRYRELLSEGYKVGLETGDIKEIPKDCEYICCTQEIYTNKYAGKKNATLIIDEFHYIFDNPQRSRTYIDSLIKSQARDILLCSATFGNMDELKGYVEKVSKREFCTHENIERLTELTYEGSILPQDIHDALVVAFSRGGCDRIVQYLEDFRDGKEGDINQISELAKKYKINNQFLIEKVKKGVACYYGSLLPKEKLFIEELFEKRIIDTVVGTDALALGVNFPVESVVFAQLAKYYDGVISKNLFEQLAGRAGRKGYFDSGRVYYCDKFHVENMNFYTSELYEALKSGENESISIDLSADIKAILLGQTTIQKEAEFVVDYSTSKKDLGFVKRDIQEVIDYIKNYSIVVNEYEQEEVLTERDKIVQREFDRNISEVYFDELDYKTNCDIFRDILVGKELDEILNVYCKNQNNDDNGYNFYRLLQIRKYLRSLPKKYKKNLKICDIDSIINGIDDTALNIRRGAITPDQINGVVQEIGSQEMINLADKMGGNLPLQVSESEKKGPDFYDE